MDLYRQAWTSTTASAALLGITTSFVLITLAEPGLTAAVLVVVAAAAHAQARLRANGVQVPAEIIFVARVVLAGTAIGGLVCVLGSVAWTLLATLAMGVVPLLRQESRSSPGRSEPRGRTDASRSGDRCTPTDTRQSVHVGDNECVRILDRWQVSFFDAADNATNELPVPQRTNAEHEASSTDSLSTTELCRAWSRSLTAIQLSTSPLQSARISQARQVYLDALEVRDPAGMARWLRAQPRADSDLTLHLNALVKSESTD